MKIRSPTIAGILIVGTVLGLGLHYAWCNHVEIVPAAENRGDRPQMPRWRATQTVWGERIETIEPTDGGAIINGQHRVSAEFIRRESRLQKGGYYVEYLNADGSWYQSWAPAEEFERGHRRM